jgi:hypothetical protein
VVGDRSDRIGDRVQDEQEKLDRTQVMSEVSQAYERGDLARLLELEQSWLSRAELRRDDEKALQREIERLKATNKELRRQLRELQTEDRQLRAGPGIVDAAGQVRFHFPVQSMLDELEAMVINFELTRDFTERFAAGEMSVEDFLEGPELPDELVDDEGMFDTVAIHEQLLEVILNDFVADHPRPRGKPAHGKKKKKKKRKKKKGR